MSARACDILVVGGGPAGLAAAAAARTAGADVLVAERDDRLGGILNQCVHDGFGLRRYGESLTGPEFAARLLAEAQAAGAPALTSTSVLSLAEDRTVRLLGPEGYEIVRPAAVVLAMGCRERPFGALRIASARPSGIWTAGAAQRLINVDGLTVGRRAVILGSGDVGLIMARRLTLQGAHVACVVERAAYPGGLPRNVSQCLNDFSIPLLLRSTVTETHGVRRLEAVTIADVDDFGAVLPGTERRIECDTLLLSVGLVPEVELASDAGALLDGLSGGPSVDAERMTSVEGVFACGNVLHVHDIADMAAEEGTIAGTAAARFAAGQPHPKPAVAVRAGEGVRYTVPQRVPEGLDVAISLRVNEPSRRKTIEVFSGGGVLYACPFEVLAPSEMVTIDIPIVPHGTHELEVRVV